MEDQPNQKPGPATAYVLAYFFTLMAVTAAAVAAAMQGYAFVAFLLTVAWAAIAVSIVVIFAVVGQKGD